MKPPILHLLPALALGLASSHGAIVWQVGMDDNAWPTDLDGGGPNATFVQEAGINPLPGDPNSPEVAAMADDDYYFAGVYSTVLDGGSYTPVGLVSANEEAAERAFAGTDNSLRYHFNLDVGSVDPTALLSVSFDALNLDENGAEPRYGVEVYFNNVLVMPEVLINQALIDADTDIVSPLFTLDSVNAEFGAGFDNYVELRGINKNAETPSGGNWMGVDYVQLNTTAIPEPSPFGLALLVGAGALAIRRASRR